MSDTEHKNTGNQFWEFRSKHGRDKLFSTPELLWEAACEYFQWCDDNPLIESKAFSFQGEISIAELPKMRAYTIGGLTLYLGVNPQYLNDFEKGLKDNDPLKDGFSSIIREIKETIYNQKFTGAAADLLNANIIARDLGLSDKKDLSSSDGTMTPAKSFSPEEYAEAAKRIQMDDMD